ncbi:MAG: hypothetical protein ACE5H0_12520 [Bacteroidota bacterium]
MFDVEIDAVLNSIKLSNPDNDCRRLVANFETELTEDVSAGIGNLAKSLYTDLIGRKIKHASVKNADEDCIAKFEHDAVAFCVRKCRKGGRAVVLIHSDESAKPLLRFELSWLWTDSDLQYFSRRIGSTIRVKLLKHQQSLTYEA